MSITSVDQALLIKPGDDRYLQIRSWASAVGKTKINSPDPPLLSIWTAYTPVPLRTRTMLFHPPVERSAC